MAGPDLGDSVAWSDNVEPEPGVHLHSSRAPDGRFKSPAIDEPISTGAFQVPIELAVPLRSGGLGLYWRDNDPPDPAHWACHGPIVVDRKGRYQAAALIQSTYGGTPGNLEIVARRGDDLVHLWRDAASKRWSGPFLIPWG